jgi:hypothetical protein
MGNRGRLEAALGAYVDLLGAVGTDDGVGLGLTRGVNCLAMGGKIIVGGGGILAMSDLPSLKTVEGRFGGGDRGGQRAVQRLPDFRRGAANRDILRSYLADTVDGGCAADPVRASVVDRIEIGDFQGGDALACRPVVGVKSLYIVGIDGTAETAEIVVVAGSDRVIGSRFGNWAAKEIGGGASPSGGIGDFADREILGDRLGAIGIDGIAVSAPGGGIALDLERPPVGGGGLGGDCATGPGNGDLHASPSQILIRSEGDAIACIGASPQAPGGIVVVALQGDFRIVGTDPNRGRPVAGGVINVAGFQAVSDNQIQTPQLIIVVGRGPTLPIRLGFYATAFVGAAFESSSCLAYKIGRRKRI